MWVSRSLKQMAKRTVTAFLSDDLRQGLKDLADFERRSLSQMIAVLIERAVMDARQKGQIPTPGENPPKTEKDK